MEGHKVGDQQADGKHKTTRTAAAREETPTRPDRLPGPFSQMLVEKQNHPIPALSRIRRVIHLVSRVIKKPMARAVKNS